LTDRGLGVVSNPATLGVFMALHAPRAGPNRGGVDAMTRGTRRSHG